MSTTTQPTPFSGRGAPRRGSGGRVSRGSGPQRNSNTGAAAAGATTTSSSRGGSFQPRGRARGASRGRGSTSNRGNSSKPATSKPTPSVPDIFGQLRNTSQGNKRAATNAFANAGLLPNQNATQSRDPRRRGGASFQKKRAIPINDYNARYEQLKIDREEERVLAIESGQMADPDNQRSLKEAITPVGTCTEMCPEFERVERIVQKMVDRAEKLDDGEALHDKEDKMIKRFKRPAAGNEEQLPSDIRTPATLLQTLNYLLRHVIGPDEHDFGLIHKFVWDRTRSIRNDLSVQQLTQVDDVKIAVKCLERIARFHILSLHLLSSPDNTEQFDHYQERQQLSATLTSLLHSYDDNRRHINFPNEDEFRAYHIIFSTSDLKSDLEDRVQRWPRELRESPRVKVALELVAAAGNTWEYQGSAESPRQSPIAQNNYIRFFELIKSNSTSYLMACVAEIYFSYVRQTAIRSIWKAYCRQPISQQGKNREWTVPELTAALYFDRDEQTVEFCMNQGLNFTPDEDGNEYLDWAQTPIDSIEFEPTSEQVFSNRCVEAKRCGRTMVALIMGMSVAQALKYDLVDEDLIQVDEEMEDRDEELFVEPGSDESEKSPLYPSEQEPPAFLFSQPPATLRPSSPSMPFKPLPAPEAQLLPRVNPFSGSSASPLPAAQSTFNPWGAASGPTAIPTTTSAPSFEAPNQTPFSSSPQPQQPAQPSLFAGLGGPNGSEKKPTEEENQREKEKKAAEERERQEKADRERQRIAEEAAATVAALKAETERVRKETWEKVEARRREAARKQAEENEERRRQEEIRDQKERQLQAELEAERRERARLEKEIREAKTQERIRRQEEEERQATQFYIMKQKEAEHRAQLEKERRLRDIEREIEEDVERQKGANYKDDDSINASYVHESPRELPLTMEELLGNEFSRSTSSVPEKSPAASRPLINEDELLLSAARVAAQKMAGGRQWLSDYTKTLSRSVSAAATPSFRSSFGYSSSYDNARGASEGSRLTVNGYDVALAPEDTRLGRSISRTEQRIRLTGAHGLASLPIETPQKPKEQSSRRRKRIKLDRESA